MRVKNLTLSGYINFTPIFTYSDPIFYFIDTVRDIGKTWALKRLIWRRAFKYGKKAIYVRRFEKEANKASKTFYQSRDIIQFCTGMEPYDPTTKKGNMKQEGSTFYIKRNGKWTWFLQIASLGQKAAFRSADDVDCDRIYYDEYTTTPERYKLYRGNECEDFIDLVVSISRQHPIKAVFTGNKESHSNPYYEYFGIPPLPSSFEGIRTYKNKSIAVYQRNSPLNIGVNERFSGQLKKALKDTQYGNYLYYGAYKRDTNKKFYSMPVNAQGFFQCEIKGYKLRFKAFQGYIYVDTKPDTSLAMFTDNLNCRPFDFIFNKKEHKPLLRDLEINLVNNRIRYNSGQAYEGAQALYKFLNFIS